MVFVCYHIALDFVGQNAGITLFHLRNICQYSVDIANIARITWRSAPTFTVSRVKFWVLLKLISLNVVRLISCRTEPVTHKFARDIVVSFVVTGDSSS